MYASYIYIYIYICIYIVGHILFLYSADGWLRSDHLYASIHLCHTAYNLLALKILKVVSNTRQKGIKNNDTKTK